MSNITNNILPNSNTPPDTGQLPDDRTVVQNVFWLMCSALSLERRVHSFFSHSNNVTMATTNAPNLQALLYLSSPLTLDDSPLKKSYQELACFFSCLIQANKNNNNKTTTPVGKGIAATAANLQDLLHLLGLIEDDENALIHQILLQERNQAKKLLVILFLLDLFSNPLDGFASLWELILVECNQKNEEPILSSETFEACLDTCLLVEEPPSSSALEDSAVIIIRLCQEFPFKASTGSTTLLLKEDEVARGELRWCRSCHTLAKLCKALPSHKRGRILETAVALTTSALRTVVNQNDEMMLKLLLKPLTDDLLPLLLVDGDEDLYSTHRHRIWNSIWSMFQESSVSSNATLIAATTVLCIILPTSLNEKLPVSPLIQNQLMVDPPIQHQLLWKLIHQCLGQGLHVPQKSSWVQGERRKPAIEKDKLDVSSLNQLQRRRGLYLLGLLVEGRQSSTIQSSRVAQWRKYVACFETLEMEFESHLVDQVWPTVTELFEQAAAFERQRCKNRDESSLSMPPICSWDWLKLLLSTILTSDGTPVLRKLSLYRLFKGEAGIQVSTSPYIDNGMRSQKSASVSKGAPLSMITPDFLFDSIIPSYNTLAGSVGLTIHTKEDKKVVSENMVTLMDNFLYQYVRTCVDEKDEIKTQELVCRLFGPDIVCELHRKTTVQLFRCISGALKDAEAPIIFSREMLQTAVSSFKSLFSLGSLVRNYNISLLEDLALILAQSRTTTTAPDPTYVLDILAFYPEPPSLTRVFDGDGSKLHCGDVDSPENTATRMLSLLRKYVRTGISCDEQWAATAGATLSTGKSLYLWRIGFEALHRDLTGLFRLSFCGRKAVAMFVGRWLERYSWDILV